LAAGKTGVIQVVEPDTTATFSYTPAPPYTLGTDAIIIATNATVDIGRIAIWAYERGTRLADNATVTGGRKVALFFNATTAPGVYNADAYALFDAAINWGLAPAPFLPIVASLKSPSPAGAMPNAPLTIELEDGTASVVQSSIVLSLNGTAVASPIITKSGLITKVTSQPSALFGSGTTNTVRIVYTDNAATPKTFTNSFQFVVNTYGTLPSYFYPIAAADASAPGFRARVVQANAFPTLANSTARAEAQLAGTLIDVNTGAPYPNSADLSAVGPDGFFVDANVINWNRDAGGIGAEIGNFRAPTFPDEPIPGLPGTDPSDPTPFENAAAEILTFLELQPGVYTLGVNSDDGFVVSAGSDARDVLHSNVGVFEGGRGSADTTFSFIAPAAGLYSFRVLWYQGNGGANLEFFSVDPATGAKILVNDRSNAKAIKAWRLVTELTRPYLSAVSPGPGATGVAISSALDFTFQNGTAAVNTNTLQIKLNGQSVAITTAEKTGNAVHIVADPPGDLVNFTVYNVQLIYEDTASPSRFVTNQFAFTTIRKPIQESPAGLSVVEAEQFTRNVAQGVHQWQFVQTPAGYSGAGDMYAFPDAPGAVIETEAGKTTAPRLDFEISFVKTGTHYFWFRGSDGGGNSINAGIDGEDPNGSLANLDLGCCGTRLVPNGTSYVWVGGRAGAPANFEVDTLGVHTINVWMREDGQLIDKVLVTTDPSFVPTGAGPDQSPRVGQAAPTITITSPTANQSLPVGNVNITVNAQDEGFVSKVEFFESGAKIGESTVSPFSFTWNSVPNGIYFLSAKATDNEGFSTTTASVRIVVGTPGLQVGFLRSAAGSASDTAALTRLRARGYQVREIPAPTSVVGDVSDKDLVVISSTVASGDVVKFAGVAKPILNWETAVVDEFGIEGSNINGLALAGQTSIIITDPTHQLAAGLPAGPVTVYSSPRDVGTMGSVYGSLKVVATTADGTGRPAIVAVETGDALNPARLAAAPARRVSIYLVDTFAFTTTDGQKLFDAAIDWLLGIVPAPTITATQLPGQIKISWTNGGTLEWTSALTTGAVWTPLTGSASPYTESTTTGTRFFRVRK